MSETKRANGWETPALSTGTDKCHAEGGLLRPCSAMEKAIEDAAPSTHKGLIMFQTINFETGKPSKSLVYARSGDFTTYGVVLRYCPFCGADVYSHWDA
jgi:hypothetical protein